MGRYFTHFLVIAGMGLGLLTGWADIGFLNQTATVSSELFLRLLKLISMPIIFLAITSTISGMTDLKEMRTLGKKVMTYTLTTTLLAASIALGIYLLVDPSHVSFALDGAVSAVTKEGSYLSFAMNIIPANLFQALLDNNVIAIAFVSMAFSLSILFLPQEQKEFLHKLFSSLFGATLKVTTFIISLMPIAIWAFVTILYKDFSQNYAHFSSLMLYLACVVGANLVQGFVVLPIMLKLKGLKPLKAARGMLPALTMAFFSKSSNATLPITLQSIEKNLGVSKKISSFSLPLCTVINMNGCAAFILTTVLFVASVNGITFGAFDYVTWILFATIAAIGNAGVPMGCFFLTSAFLVGMNVPLYMMGLILPFYTILDMIETTLNVWSDACVTLSIDKDLQPALVADGSEAA